MEERGWQPPSDMSTWHSDRIFGLVLQVMMVVMVMMMVVVVIGPRRTFQNDDDVAGGCYNSGCGGGDDDYCGDDDDGCCGNRTSPHFSRPSRVAFARVVAVAVKNLSTLLVRILNLLKDPHKPIDLSFLFILIPFN